MRDLLRALASIVLCPALALFLFCEPCSASPAHCTGPREIAESALARIPDAEITILGGERAKRFLATYNARPPQTNLIADVVMIVDPGRSSAVVFAVLFEEGCAVSGGKIARALFEKILTELNRDNA